MDKQRILSMIDHTLLKQEATQADIKRVCQEAVKYRFASVCIQPCFVKLAAEELSGSDIPVCTVVGFPMGVNRTDVKVFETQKAIADGAGEIDMVINVGALKQRCIDAVEEDINAVVKAAQGRTVKVIFETCLLTEQEKQLACQACVNAGAHYVKTSTGYAGGGATVEDVRLMYAAVNGHCKVKAAGGIRTLEQCRAMIEAGAERIGSGSAMAIAEGEEGSGCY